MPREDQGKAVGKTPSMEANLYDPVAHFLATNKKCEKTGHAVTAPLMLTVFGGSIYPDVYGVYNPTTTDFRLHMAEGKIDLTGRNFDECKGQAISLQRFADYVYVFFPREPWDDLEEEEKSQIEEDCNNLKLGLLIVDGKSVQEKTKASSNTQLLKEDNRLLARDKIARYFPDFAGAQQSADFFGKHSEIADSITSECCILMYELSENFRAVTKIKKQSLKLYSENEARFEFYFEGPLKKSTIYCR